MAAADGNRPIRGAAYRVYFKIRNNSTGKLISGAASVTSVISLDGASAASSTNTVTEIGPSLGVYYLDLVAAEMAATKVILVVDSGSANAETVVIEILTEQGMQAGTATAGGDATIRLATAAESVINDYYNGATIELVKGTGAGQSRTIIDYDANTRQATVDRDWETNPDTSTGYVVHPMRNGYVGADGMLAVNADRIDDSATAAELLKKLFATGLVSSSVNDVTPAANDFDGAAGLSTTVNFYRGSVLVFTSGTLAGLGRRITAYSGSTTRTFSFNDAFPAAPANGDTFVILGRID